MPGLSPTHIHVEVALWGAPSHLHSVLPFTVTQ